HGDGGGQGADLALAEVPAQAGAQGAEIGAAVEPGERLGPGQRRLLPVAEVADLVPDDDPVETFAGLAVVALFPVVHLDAEGTAVDLRGPQLHEMLELPVEAMIVDGRMHGGQGLEDGRNLPLVADGTGVTHRELPDGGAGIAPSFHRRRREGIRDMCGPCDGRATSRSTAGGR